MKKLLFKILLLGLPVIMLSLLCEHKLDQIPNTYRRKRVLLESRLDRVQVLNFGSSHEYHGINPAYWNCQAVNLANFSQDLYYDDKLLLKYLDQMPQLKLVILPVSYLSLEYNLSLSREEWRRFFYRHYFDLPRDPNTSFALNDVIRDISLLALYTPRRVPKYAITGFANVTELTENLDQNGWYGLAGNYHNFISDQTGLARIEFHHKYMNPDFIAENTGYLDKMVSELQKRKIGVVIVTLPVWQTYSKFFRPEKYQTMQTTIQDITNRYHIEYHNYLFDNRFELADFYDNDHLNTVGAEKLSRILNDEVIGKYVK